MSRILQIGSLLMILAGTNFRQINQNWQIREI